MFSINISYPTQDDEVNIVKSTTSAMENKLSSIVSKESLLNYQSLVRRVPVADNVVEFAVDLVTRTRPGQNGLSFINDWLEWGAGPRASQYLILGAKAKAVLDGRPTPDISDVISMVQPVLRHRIITNFNAEADGVKTENVLDKLVEEIG
jgi:MoxR-like ATPase